mmetsp:Transcript_12048/g.21374  ORF Transcript_12048/g.21374 Transcript_12048/m.21374 type:complete len:249 (+) Transcript_12048:88-834(+)|eukprot:CAMPEP_0197648336 /NCGR_PEP_ID=MMETSP1338-20131121/27694_1 /TAXON_ID=43686 ORGANISM="Pelagodinium beii, Strain RCC1491" /NCGR_SAMPLE_ID=MMETSP1338 /ASSEMBLY_ACC=CAM_ASM_000754 /LENGTH=248 /DNA_ID=CAMNT_0043222315 /DNA_START=59 /DNA_END=805 /DNA_ORIENTATION=+
MSETYRNRSGNAVLLKDDVGRARPTYYDLPHEGHAYGRSEPADVEGAREVTMHWAAHVPRPRLGPDCQDFKKLNRSAAKSGVRNARDLSEFRRGSDFKLTTAGPAGVLPKVIPSDVIPSFSYGQKSRPSTPIAHVVGNQYGTEMEEALDVQYRLLEERQKMQSKTIIKLTKASKANISEARLRRRDMEEPPEPKEPFKLTKFKKITSKLGYPASIRKSSSMPTLQRLPPEMPFEELEVTAAELDLAEE